MIDVLLATYQSERFLTKQLDSLLAQDCPGFRILIRDGGSSDQTPAVISAYQVKHPDKITVLAGGKADAVQNFALLLGQSTAPYVMFCDHDDIWLSNKISASLTAVRRLEAEHGVNTPCLVHCRADLIDEKDQIIARNLAHFYHWTIKPDGHIRCDIPTLGCTMMVNRALADLAQPIPAAAGSHDTWLGRLAWYAGAVDYVDQTLLLYRVHPTNASGASGRSHFRTMLKRLRRMPDFHRRMIDHYLTPAKLFFDRYHAIIPGRYYRQLQMLASLESCGFWTRKYRLIRYQIRANGCLRTLGFWLFL